MTGVFWRLGPGSLKSKSLDITTRYSLLLTYLHEIHSEDCNFTRHALRCMEGFFKIINLSAYQSIHVISFAILQG